MALRFLYYLVFWLLMAVNIISSLVVVVFLYLPFVALKAVWMTLAGKAKPRLPAASSRGQESPGSAT